MLALDRPTAHSPTPISNTAPTKRRTAVTAGELGAIASAIGLWLAFPPIGLDSLAWIAPVGWLRMISQPTSTQPLRYGRIYLIGWLHWLLLIAWIRLPHWSAYFGWLALTAYLAIYLPLFIGLTRHLVHRWRVPIVAAAPMTWVGLELARGHLLSGFSLSLLGHTQVAHGRLIQIADLCGAYGVSFLVMMGAACVERCWPRATRPTISWCSLGAFATLLLAVLAYGHTRPASLALGTTARSLQAGLIQGVFDTQFDGDRERPRQAFLDYARLSRELSAQHRDLDLIIWPESMFTATQPMISFDEPLQTIADWDGTVEQLRERLLEYATAFRARALFVTQQTQTPLLVGLEWDHITGGREQRYNAAVLVSRRAEVVDRYDKMHRVMFGEYVPLGEWLPWLYHLTPMHDGLTPGDSPRVFEIDGVRLAPSICFENTVPHLIRRQCRELAAKHQPPDVLVTITNDGWFWGSSLLDVHLACGIFRAIELRRPLLIAANTGFSAVIERSGTIVAQGPRRQEGTLFADLQIADQPTTTFYETSGDLGAAICLLLTTAAGLHAVASYVAPRRHTTAQTLT